ncbi:hypothetical protein SAMN05216312_102419 [Cohnella sp. OV330]|uniref:hypothetical protein n=1 Tax=Cohnella sp. OV330 TaxID=1855288 RepID=UPI0008EC858E|nr:hypothetical protein [Cohnella sp. OV330]SFA94399.1 hypothetical protein SAMN05216312_102419 [Cohnella sp. OV330]
MSDFLRQFALLILAGCILSAGFVVCIVSFFSSLNDRDYLALNAKTTIPLQPGKYEIFYEYTEKTREMGPLTFTKNNEIVGISDLVTVMVDDGKASLDLTEDRTSTYTDFSKKGESMYRFTVKEEGTYGITVISNAEGLQKYARFTVMGDMKQRIIALFKSVGLSFAAAAPFLIAGLTVYARIEKRKLAVIKLRMQR